MSRNKPVLPIVLLIVSLVAGYSGLSARSAAADAAILQDVVIVPPGNPIEIAFANTLIVPEAADVALAVEMAVADFGAIHGFSVQLNDFDPGCNAVTAATVAATIVANTQHVGVVGPLCSADVMGAAPVFESAGLVMVSGSATIAGIALMGPHVFNRTVIADPEFTGWDLRIGGLSSVADWEAEFLAAHGHAPWQFARYAYDAAWLMLSRIEEVSAVAGGGSLEINRADLATAIRTTTEFIGVTGNLALTTEGDRVDQYTTAVWTDAFSLSTLDPDWSWIDEDPTHWSLTAHPGFLRIVTQPEGNNRLVTPAPAGDFEIRARVLFEPQENFQFAGISVYLDEENFLNLGRAYCNVGPPTCLDNAIYFDFVEGGVFVPPNYAMTTTVTAEAYVRIERSGSSYTGYVSTDGTSWQLVGTHSAVFTPAFVGLYASGQSAVTEIAADFDFFVLEFPAFQIFMPAATR